MTKFYYPIILFFLLGSTQISAQQSENYQLWKAAVERHKQAGTFEGFHAEDDIEDGLRTLEKNGGNCPEVDQGYGTPGWNPNSSPSTDNADPACTLQNNLIPCNGGKYRIAFRNIIFECPNWQGDNYLESGTGFRSLTDQDLNTRLANLNASLAGANIELVEVERSRVTDCDMYDFYFRKWGKDPNRNGNDGINDEDQINAYDEDRVFNLYWVGGFNGNHGCCGPQGFIDKLPTPLDYGIMRYSVSMHESSLQHDIAHFFGIYHPHWDLEEHENVKVGYPDGALNNSDCLTHGDGICDTWPGAALEYKCSEECRNGGTDQYCYQGNNCSFNMNNYQCVNGHTLQIHPDEGTRIDQYTSTVLSNNYATYNANECRQTYTPCQYYKMNAIALSCRSHLCIQEHDQYFYSPTDYDKQIGTGDAIPTFVAGKSYTTFDGSSYDVDCFDWFLNDDDLASEAVVQNSNTFDPSAYVNGAGTYTFYMAEVNSLSNPPCKIPVKLTITQGQGGGNGCNDPLPGTTQGSKDVSFSGENNALSLQTSGATLSGNETVNWWITRTQPISDAINSQNGLNTRLSAATINPEDDGSGISGDANVIFQQSHIGSSALIDCSGLTPGADYYATPFVGTATTTTTGGGGSSTCQGSFTYASSKFKGDPLRVAIMKRNTLNCASAEVPTYTLTVQVSGYTGTNSNFRMYIVPETSKDVIKLIESGDNGTFVFNESDLDGYDPNPEGLRVAVLEKNGDGGKNVNLTVTLDITYGNSGEPTSETTMSANYSNCLFGTPVVFRCGSNLGDGNSIQSRRSQQLSTRRSLQVYPSPTDGNQVNVVIWGTKTTDLEIELYNMKGQLLSKSMHAIIEGRNSFPFELPNLNSGLYMIKTTQQGEVENIRFSVVR